MGLALKLSADHCPACQSPLKLEDGVVPNPMVCPECGRELVIRPKHLKSLLWMSLMCGFVVSYIQKLEVPVFLVAFPVYSFLVLLCLRQFVMPFVPHELVAAHLYTQRLGRLDPPEPK
jgi:predicted RNA-binding Zn-ribbon protein involved in translation (DUF1610 family)